MPDISIVSPNNSFVKFGAEENISTCCEGDDNFCIPVVEETDTWFQVNLECINDTVLQQIFDSAPENFQLILLSGTGNTAGTYVANTLRNWKDDGLLFTKFKTAETVATILWKQNFKDIKTLVACDECFELALVVIVDSITYVAISNCFIRKCEDCFLSVLEYTNEKDDFEFSYCNTVNPINRVRLPFFFQKPQFPDEEGIYKFSSGRIKVLKSITSKEYSALVDFAPEHIHEKLKIALAHDTKSIISEKYTGEFVKNGSYTIDWEDIFLCRAQANFKALVSPYSAKVNSCSECTDLENNYLCQVQIGDLTHESVEGGEKISWTQTHGGSFPNKYQLSSPTINGGVPIDVAGNVTDYTYDDMACGEEHIITITPYCQIDGELYAGEPQTINVEIECPCVGATVDESVVIPDGEVGEYLDYSFDIDGTEPFYITDEVKPAWMSIVLDENTVHIYGTPDAPGTDIPVSFTISNCTETETTTTLPFSQTINVIE